jgi:hypothetical protein
MSVLSALPISHPPPLSFSIQAILTTNRFVHQSTPLAIEDLDAWHWALAEVDGFGFYNSDPISGSSQPHKHVQLIPRSSLHWRFERSADSGEFSLSENEFASSELPIESLLSQHLSSSSPIPWAPFNPLRPLPASTLHTMDQVSSLPFFLPAQRLTPTVSLRSRYRDTSFRR